MFEGAEAVNAQETASRRPGVGAILLMLLLLGFFANAALFRVASDAARRLPDSSVLSPLRGGHEPGGLSTDALSTVRATFRPQRGAAILPIGSFRSPGWMPHARAARPDAHGRCTGSGDAV